MDRYVRTCCSKSFLLRVVCHALVTFVRVNRTFLLLFVLIRPDLAWSKAFEVSEVSELSEDVLSSSGCASTAMLPTWRKMRIQNRTGECRFLKHRNHGTSVCLFYEKVLLLTRKRVAHWRISLQDTLSASASMCAMIVYRSWNPLHHHRQGRGRIPGKQNSR